jgi:pimeloyl-ACP methyl ester carboxylesterase
MARSGPTRHRRSHAQDLRGASKLVIDATCGVTSIVEDMQSAITRGPGDIARTITAPVQQVSRLVYATVRGVTQLVGGAIDVALAPLVAVLGDSPPGPERDAVLAAINGVVGDHLSETGNPLAITMQLHHAGAPIELTREALRAALPHASGKIVVLVHGLCLNDRQWNQRDHDHGAALARDLGYTAIYLRYNTGRHISSNGAELAELLERMVAAWPVAIDDLVLLGHSMGGLVARSACRAGELAGHDWRRRLGALVALGSPHHGAPLERGGHGLDVLLGISRYTAPFHRLARIRSAGITDLRYGNVLDEHWQGVDRHAPGTDLRRPLELPRGVACYAVAGTLGGDAGRRSSSDGLVSVASALGIHERPELTLAFPDGRRWIASGTGHIGLLGAPEVYQTLRAWLADDSRRE